jgi:hypothetical protein
VYCRGTVYSALDFTELRSTNLGGVTLERTRERLRRDRSRVGETDPSCLAYPGMGLVSTG